MPKAVKVYNGKIFARFAKRARIGDRELWTAAQRAEGGLIDAALGGGVIKLRIARPGEGKSGGSRSIVLFRKGDRAVFVFGFEKKDRSNIKPDELERFQKLAEIILTYTAAELRKRIEDGELIRVIGAGEEENGENLP